MPFVEEGGIGDIEVTHERLKVCPGCLHNEMEVITHEDEGDKRDLIDLDGPGKEVEKTLPVCSAQKDVLSPVAPAGDMVAGVLILNAKGTGHGSEYTGGKKANQE